MINTWFRGRLGERQRLDDGGVLHREQALHHLVGGDDLAVGVAEDGIAFPITGDKVAAPDRDFRPWIAPLVAPIAFVRVVKVDSNGKLPRRRILA